MAGTGTLAPTLATALATYASWTILFLFGHLRDFYRKTLAPVAAAGVLRAPKAAAAGAAAGAGRELAPLRQDYEDFYTRRMYYRIHDCWNRPIESAPGAWVDVAERTPVAGLAPLALTGGPPRRCLNLGSYNYLGFAAVDEHCTPRVEAALDALGWGGCAARADGGTTPAHAALEAELADFLGAEAALTCGMGFATNAVFLPALGGRGTLFVSDALNHASIVAGVRGSGAKVRVFEHNDPRHLDAVLRAAVAEGQPRTGRPWRKIVVVVEGIYSMEGELARLREIVAVKKRYKAYLWLDEAHSIGALGATGRGVCEAAGVPPRDVDVLMGTFTKSFGSCGGYVAGSRALVDWLRARCPAHVAACAMSPPAVEMVRAALAVVRGADGSRRGAAKLARLRANANYLRRRLLAARLNVLGDWDSPVMPVMVFNPGKLPAVSREMLRRGVAVVVVGFPATPLLTARMRVCVSAAHSRADLDYAADALEEVADLFRLRYAPPPAPARGPRGGGKEAGAPPPPAALEGKENGGAL